MYKDVKKYYENNDVIYYKQFKNLDDFLMSILSTDINPIFKTRFASINVDREFSGTRSYQEAWEMARYTLDEGFEKFYSQFKYLTYQFNKTPVIKNNYSVVGYNPSVPRYLKGIPTSMNSYHTEYLEESVHIYYPLAYSHYISKEQVRNRGLLTLALIDYFEKQNIKVEFYSYEMTKEENEKLLMVIPLKRGTERLNVKKCYFPIVHPSFLRRLMFRAKELMPLTNEEWSNGYGIPYDYHKSIEFLKKHSELIDGRRDQMDEKKIIFISTPNELGINGQNLQEDCENFLKSINSSYTELFDTGTQKTRKR